MPDRGQGIPLEPADAGDREIIEPEGEVGEVAEEGEAEVPPIDAGLEALIRFRLHPLRDPVAKEQRQDHQQGEQEYRQRPGDGQDAGGSLHLLPQPNSSLTVQTAMIMAATSAVSPAGTAWRVFLMFTAPK